MKKLLAISLICLSFSTFAMNCKATKDGDESTALKGVGSKSAVIDSYQFDAILVGDTNFILQIFDRRTPSSSARAVISGLQKGQIVSTSLETQDGIFQITCK